MYSPWLFPDKAKFGRVVPKNKIYEHSAASAGVKSLFVEQVDQILWAYKLSSNTLNMPQTSEVSEIQVFSVKLKGDSIDESVLKAIDLAIPFPIIFEVWVAGGEQGCYVACYKRKAENDQSKWVCSRYLYSETFYLGNSSIVPSEVLSLPTAIDMAELYQKLLTRLLPIPKRTAESIKEVIERFVAIQALEKQISQYKKKVHAEKQFNRKVELNKQLKNLRCELEELLA
ncbi:MULTISPECIES: DUF4391 domain-containing protein [Morganellaceae]|uniref:DUF4391 domain-containing protein n=1 Tax=Morganellaceae TaxID=1903414 RepID=UPI001A266CBA|nr:MULTISPECIES: DUF4391 domain-containing protein [Morganellaceae]MBI6380019.1 DUF4391 domain-containing protein [Proteus mirabilis]MBI6407316.1 DUF4391 domain-containing protein [Proteus mirabilis]MBP6083214.1 DUF4391 domain-containing protein [Providencia sp.]MDF7412652.1 DUF4391 domain-containing protein [Proteus mirabilis]HEK1059702.1 DUF4391 domain-containing protein [Proteus mirabilis]